MKFELHGRTNVGRKRTLNEDSLVLMPELRLAVVADGMGGHSSGEVASGIAVKEVADFFALTDDDPDATWPYKLDSAQSYDANRLVTAVKLANMRIFERASSDSKFKGMGTTIVACYAPSESEVLIAHVGDSRLYHLRDGRLTQITEDHSLLADYMRTRKMTPEEVEAFPHKNVIVRALGMSATVKVDLNRIVPEDDDILLLCSDGLSGLVSDQQIGKLVMDQTDLKGACDALIDAANQAGGTDNITCVLARVHLPKP